MRTALLAALVASTAAGPALAGDEASVRDHLKGSLEETETTRVNIGFADLNGDGNDEALVYLLGPYWCGSGGCNVLVLTPEGGSWKEIGNTTVSSLPVGVLDTETDGWKDLAVSFGSAIESGIGQIKWEGDAYDRNPTTAPRAKDIGTLIIPEDAEATAL